MCSERTKELVGAFSVLLASILAIVTYYPGDAPAKLMFIVSGLTVVYASATLGPGDDKLVCLAVLSSLAASLLFALHPAFCVLLAVSLLLVALKAEKPRSLSVLAALSVAIYLWPLVSLLVAIFSSVLALERRKLHMLLVPAGFLLSGFLAWRGLLLQSSLIAVAASAAISLYASRGFNVCPFRVEARLASLGLGLVAAVAVLASFLPAYKDILLAVFVGSLYLYYSGLLAPRS